MFSGNIISFHQYYTVAEMKYSNFGCEDKGHLRNWT